MKLANRWLLLTGISAVLTFLGLTVADFTKLAPGWQATVYIGITLLIVIVNLVRLHHFHERSFSINPFHYIPTTAALARFLITLSLAVSFFSDVYPYWPALVYLTYFYFMASTYDLPEYHKHFLRGSRVVADLVLAAIVFCSNGGLRNPTWIMFLVPITTMSRHYVSWKPLCTTLSSILFISIVSIYSNPSSMATVDVMPILRNLGPQFSAYLKEPTALTNWENFKLLFVANFVMILATLIFHAETKNRLRTVFNFAARFFDYVMQKNKNVTSDMLNYLCVSLNVEAIVVVITNGNQPSELQYTFQNRNESTDYNARCSHKRINEMGAAQDRAFTEWWAKVTTYIQKQQEHYRKQNAFVRWLFKDNRATLEAGEIQQLHSYAASSLLAEFKSIFLKPDDHMMKTRANANLYKTMELVSIVPFTIGNSHFIILNDLPTKFRIVPRPFWDDGVQKIRMAKYILE